MLFLKKIKISFTTNLMNNKKSIKCAEYLLLFYKIIWFHHLSNIPRLLFI